MKGKRHEGERAKSEDVYEGGNSGTAKEAKSGSEPDEKESPARKKGGKVEGKMAKMRLDRPGRKAGGRVGADKAPLTEAAKSSQPKSRKLAHDAIAP